MTAQALPDQYPSLQQLYSMAPLMGFAQAGDMQRIADENNPRLQAAFDMNQQQDASMQPLKLAQLAAGNAHTQAQTGLIGQQTQAAQLANAFTGQTQPAAIQAANAKFGKETDVSMADQMEAQGRVFGQLSSRLQDPSLTQWEKVNLVKEAMGEHAQRYPGLDKMLMDNHGSLADRFDKLSQNSYEKSKEARKAEADETKRLAVVTAQGENALKLQEARARDALASLKIKSEMKPAKDENMSVYEARIRREAQAGNADAQQALQVLEIQRINRAQAAGLVGDDRIRQLIPQLGPRTPQAAPMAPQAPTPSPAPVQAPGSVPSPSQAPQGADYAAILAKDVASNPNAPEGAYDGAVAKLNPAQKQVFVKELWINKAMKANPGMTREAIEAEGKKRNKF